jgi:hypothetical protein
LRLLSFLLTKSVISEPTNFPKFLVRDVE